MAAPRKHPDKLRERATRLAVEARRDPATGAGGLARVAGQVGVSPETLRNWVTSAEIDCGVRPGATSDEARRSRTGRVEQPPASHVTRDVHGADDDRTRPDEWRE
jgi:transposase